MIDGPQVATVTGPPGEEIYCDEWGRVKVQFPWDRLGNNDEYSSCWIRVAQNWAGTAWGHMAIPRIGQEVRVIHALNEAYQGGDERELFRTAFEWQYLHEGQRRYITDHEPSN